MDEITPQEKLAEFLERLPEMEKMLPRGVNAANLQDCMSLIESFPAMLKEAKQEAFLEAKKFAEARDSGNEAAKGEWDELFSQGYNGACRELAKEFHKLAEEPEVKR